MLRFRNLAVAGAAALGLAGTAVAGAPNPASAAGDPVIGMQVLDMLCRSKGGTPYDTPYDHQPLPGRSTEAKVSKSSTSSARASSRGPSRASPAPAAPSG